MSYQPSEPVTEESGEPALLYKEEVARLLRTTVSHVETLAERGDLAHYRIGRFLRFQETDVEAYLANVRVDGTGVER
jgi:excisionase family DNA binding protein